MLAASSAVRAGATRRLFVLLTLILVAIAAAFLTPANAGAASGVTWQRFDVNVDLQNDGSLHVVETQFIDFRGRSYSYGYATIPLDRIDSIDNVLVREQNNASPIDYQFVPWNQFKKAAGTFSYHDTGSAVEIQWGFPPTENETRTFLLEYDAIGAVRVYTQDNQTWQQIWWTAISKDVTEIGDVLESTVTIRLPRPVDMSAVQLGANADERPQDHTTDGQSWTWTEQNLRAGDEFVVRMEFPAIVNAAPPSWQQQDDAQRLAQEQQSDRRSLYNVIFLGIGLLFAVLGGAGLYGLWYTRGRDPHAGMVADFLPEPPDDLPPGAAGSLIDEVAHERDIVATVVDLGRRGIIKIDEQKSENGLFGGAQDFSLTLLQAEPQVTEFERTLLRSLFGSTQKEGATEHLSRARGSFNQNSNAIKDQIYDELVKRGYFTASPEQTRERWRKGAIGALIAVILLACVGGGVLANLSPFVFFPIAVVAAVALGLVLLSGALPKKTPAGAEAAAKWLAFRRYLGDIEKYDRINESQQIFDKFLPYAVAFGLEESWVTKFASAGAAPPAWYGPVIIAGPGDWAGGPRHRRGAWGGGMWGIPGGPGSGWDGGGFGGGMNMPDLQDMSDQAGKTVQGTSNSFFDMLNSAARAFGDISKSGGGGRRHWGGGGGGFHGGGGHGGSSGGGGRGFG